MDNQTFILQNLQTSRDLQTDRKGEHSTVKARLLKFLKLYTTKQLPGFLLQEKEDLIEEWQPDLLVPLISKDHSSLKYNIVSG